MILVTAEQMRDLDRRATEEAGIPSLLLMENAGRSVFEETVAMLSRNPAGKKIAVVCGKGNNGGDGFVAARHLTNRNAAVQIFLLCNFDDVQGDAAINLSIAQRMGIPIRIVTDKEDLKNLVSFDLIVDAIFGTGIKGNVSGLAKDAIKAINESNRPVLSIDIPSGIDADNGSICGLCVCATRTVTFGLPKRGLYLFPGANYVGKLTVVDIGIPNALLEDSGSDVRSITAELTKKLLPLRNLDAHKGSCGHLAVIAGSIGMTGAAALTAESALRVGAGLVTLGIPESLNDILESKVTEVMTVPIPEGGCKSFGLDSLKASLELIQRCDALAIGPGIGRRPEAIEFILQLVPKVEKPMVLDADALNAISKDSSILVKIDAPVVITPHPGEMARLLGTTTSDVQSNRLEIALDCSKDWGVTVVLKGAGTVVANQQGQAFINTTGNPGMASGGMGDVLTGAIGGLLAQGLNPTESAICGVYLHGLAADIASHRIGSRGFLANEVSKLIPKALDAILCENKVEEGESF